MLAAMIDGLSESGAAERRRRRRRTAQAERRRRQTATANKNGTNLASVLSHHGDVLGRRRPAAVDAAPGPRQLRDRVGRQRRAARAVRAACGPRWRSPSPAVGSDSASIRTTAVLDGDEYVLNGEKIYVTAGERADAVVVWATLDRSSAARRSSRSWCRRARPGHDASSGSSTSSASAPPTPRRSSFEDCRVPTENLLGSPRSTPKQGFAGAMATFDNTRPLVAAMAVGCRPRLARPDPRAARARPASRSTTTARRDTQTRGGRRVPRSWRPTGRPRTC